MADNRKQQEPFRGAERRGREHDYAVQRDRKIVNFALVGLVLILAAAIADVGNSGVLIGMGTLLTGLLAVPKFLEWDERNRKGEARGEDR